MMADKDGPAPPARRTKRAPRWVKRWLRTKTGLAAVILGTSGLAACSSAGASTGPVTLNFYQFPDVSGATNTEINNCDAQSHGAYKISYQLLPAASDSQRLQLVRRLAAHDATIDIMALDVTWEPEFAEAGWIVPWTGAYKQQVVNGTIAPALDTAIWKGQLVAAPANTNTQLLWYRSDLVPTPPKTWAQMIADAEQLAKEGKPHYIEIQGAQYEGATVWFNTMNASAGGTILNPDATKVTLGPPATIALADMKELATSPAADPSLGVQMENDNRLAMEGGTAAFELNYPFVYPSMKADNPKLFKELQVGALPADHPGRAGQGDDRRSGPRRQQVLPAPGARLPGRVVPAGRAEPADRRHRGRRSADDRQPLQQSEAVPRLPVPRRHPAGARARERAAEDAPLPGRIHRHLAPDLPAERHQPGDRKECADRPAQ